MAEWQPVFATAFAELNFKQRMVEFAKIGKALKAKLTNDKIGEVLMSFPQDDSFSALNLLSIARITGCSSYAKSLLSHPAQSVRFRAVSLLSPSDAEAAFLDADSNKQLKSRLVRSCDQLPCTEAVLEGTAKVFDSEHVWLVLMRTNNEILFKEWTYNVEKLKGIWPCHKELPGLENLAIKFPDTMIGLMDGKHFMRYSWGWLLLLAQKRPGELLDSVFVHQGGMKTLSGLESRLAQWAWRHHPAKMVKVCQDVGNSVHNCMFSPYNLLKLQQGLVSSHSRPSCKTKIDTVVSIFVGLPTQKKSVAEAKMFLELFEDQKKPERTKDLESLVDAFWKLVQDLGVNMREAVVTDGLLNTFLQKVPPPVAVEQFFRILKVVDASAVSYKFVQSNICKTLVDGEHDKLMQQVFERYLIKDDNKEKECDKTEGPAAFVSMFQTLLQDVKSMDVLQDSFNKLTEKLGGVTEKSLLRMVVAKMKHMDNEVTLAENLIKTSTAEASANRKRPPAASLPLPTDWLSFIPHPKNCSPYVGFLHGALESWAMDKSLLTTTVERFGTALFWDSFDHVLAHATGNASIPNIIKPVSSTAIDMVAISGLSVVGPVAPPELGRSLSQQKGDAKKKPSVYFDNLEKKKQDSYQKDVDKRERAYRKLIQEAKKEEDVAPAFSDVVAFFVKRLGGEQENIQFAIMTELLEESTFPLELWIQNLGLLRDFNKLFAKARGRGARDAWAGIGQRLVKQALIDWRDEETEPSEMCIFAVELAQGNLDFAGLFVTAEGVLKSKEEPRLMSPHAVRWLMQSAVPVTAEVSGNVVPLQDFCKLLQQMAKGSRGDEAAERGLWNRWAFVEEQWNALLQCRVNQSGAAFILSGVVDHFIARQNDLKKKVGPQRQKGEEKFELWWAPLETKAYGDAVDRVLEQISSGEIPALAGATKIWDRVQRMECKYRMSKLVADGSGFRREQILDPPTWLQTGENKPWHHKEARFQDPRQWKNKIEEKYVLKELKVFSALLAGDDDRRQIQWLLIRVASMLQGDLDDKGVSKPNSFVDGLLKQIIDTLKAEDEGMAKVVARQYPFLNAQLSFQESTTGNVDILTPYLELWLANRTTRDVRVSELMERPDFELLLFFGNAFAEHLARFRQEYLHRCFAKISVAPTLDGEGNPSSKTAKFYHHIHRVPSLARVALYGKGWGLVPDIHDPNCPDAYCLCTSFWHPSTQNEFLKKVLVSSDMAFLSLGPQLEYVDGVGATAALLDKHPQEQIGKVSGLDFTVLQQAGNIKGSIWGEVAKIYDKTPLPVGKNAVEDREVDQILLAMGKADRAFDALKILGKYASKFKRAKDALMNAVPNLSRTEARNVIKDVMFAEKAGIALQVAALRLILDLEVPNPLDLYRMAWKDGYCHRDVAANILTKMALTTSQQWSPNDVRDMFALFEQDPAKLESKPRLSKKNSSEDITPEGDAPLGKVYPKGMFGAMSAAKKENLNYIAEMVLQNLRSNPKWGLPFLPEVLGKLALIPGNTDNAMNALFVCDGMVSEVIKTLTKILPIARMAAKAEVTSALASRPEAQLLSKLKNYGTDTSIVRNVQKMRLSECEPSVLRAFIDEFLKGHAALMAYPRSKNNSERNQVLADTFKVWLFALKPTEDASSWRTVLGDMEAEVRKQGGLEELGMLLETIVKHIPNMNLNTSSTETMVAVCREFFERILAETPVPLTAEEKLKQPIMDAECATIIEIGSNLRWKIISSHWVQLIAQGCSEGEVQKLLAYAPADKKETLATNIVNAVVEQSNKLSKINPICATIPMKRSVGRQALWWLGTPTSENHLSTLATLWPRVLEGEHADRALDKVLDFFGGYPKNLAAVKFAKVYAVDRSPRPLKERRRRVVKWLAGIAPRDAVLLWPQALFDQMTQNDPGVLVQDVSDLLSICANQGFDLSEIPTKVSPNVVKILSESELEAARLSAVRALQNMDLKGVDRPHAPILDALRSDQSTIVASFARLAWRAFFGGKDAGAASSSGGVSPPGEVEEEEVQMPKETMFD